MRSDTALIRNVAEIAGEIERLFVAGHRVSRPYVTPMRERYQLSDFGVLIDFLAVLLAPGGMPLKEAAALQPYLDLSSIEEALRVHQAQGFVDCVNNRWVPTERGHEILLHLRSAQEQGVSLLWSDSASLPRVATFLARTEVAAAGLPAASYPGFTAQRRLVMTPRTSLQLRFWVTVTRLRYFRADAHILAWKAADLTRDEIRILTHLCHLSAPTSVHQMNTTLHMPCSVFQNGTLQRMQASGWIQSELDRWEVTSAGRALRDWIEAATNEFAAPPWVGFEPGELRSVVTDMQGLPSDLGPASL